MKQFVAGAIIGAVLGGGVLAAAGLPNPQVGECELADLVVTRDEPTIIDPEGAVTGAHGWQVCGYQVPTGAGSNMRAVDGQFYFEYDLDDARDIVDAADGMLDGDDVFTADGP